jgi:hypothetical protein
MNSYSSVSLTDFSKVTDPASTSSSSKDNNVEETSAGFMKVSPEIIRPLPKDGPRITGGKEHGKSRTLTYTPEKPEIEN